MTMTMARPPAEQIEAVMDFMQTMEDLIERSEFNGKKLNSSNYARLFGCICDDWMKVSSCWQRVLWAGKTAIDNACDPKSSDLEFKPEIKAAMELRQKVEALIETLIQRECACRAKTNFLVAENSLYVQGLADGAKDAAIDLAKLLQPSPATPTKGVPTMTEPATETAGGAPPTETPVTRASHRGCCSIRVSPRGEEMPVGGLCGDADGLFEGCAGKLVMTDDHWTDDRGVVRRTPARNVTRLVFTIKLHAALRAFIFKRDAFRCQICGLKGIGGGNRYNGRRTLVVPGALCLEMDHILSQKRGGTHHPSNLRTLCNSCNARKAATEERNVGPRKEGCRG